MNNGSVNTLGEAALHPYQPLIVSIETQTWEVGGVETPVEELLESLGVDLGTEDTRETPRRVAAMYREMLTPEPFSFTTFANPDRYDELVLVRAIPFVSGCAHHLLPFKGEAQSEVTAMIGGAT